MKQSNNRERDGKKINRQLRHCQLNRGGSLKARGGKFISQDELQADVSCHFICECFAKRFSYPAPHVSVLWRLLRGRIQISDLVQTHMKTPAPFAVALAGAAVATAVLSSTSIISLPGSMPFRQVRQRKQEENIVSSLSAHCKMPHSCLLQFQTAGEIPARAFENHQIIHGRVEKIIDGDTFRIRYGGRFLATVV